MEERKYLKWYNKIGYGSGDMAANFIYGLITSFVMIYLTDSVGLNAGIVGTLIMLSKFADGVTDVFFGTLIDKTKSKMGKARPWMLYAHFGSCICLVALFAIPQSWGEVAQYAYFFITYTLLNAIFYTANNIAYAALTSLITRNGNERVQVGSIRFMFSLVTNLFVTSATVALVTQFGGGAAGWRTVAIIYAVISLIVNIISVFSVKEIAPEEQSESLLAGSHAAEDTISFAESVKLLVSNKYFLMIAGFYVLSYLQTGIAGIGIYYMTYVLGDAALLGTFSLATLVPMVIGLAITPALVKKFGGMYKVNLIGYILSTVFRLAFVAAGYMGNVALMLASSALAGLFASPITGDVNALISAASDYTVRTKGKHIEGSMFSCSSLGIKVGSGLGSAISGMLLSLSGYLPNMAQQPASTINMLHFMFLWIPFIANILITAIMYFLKVEKANADWDTVHAGK